MVVSFRFAKIAAVRFAMFLTLYRAVSHPVHGSLQTARLCIVAYIDKFEGGLACVLCLWKNFGPGWFSLGL